MPRFFVEDILPSGQAHLQLYGADAHHIAHVLRMRAGQPVLVCDGGGAELHCSIERIGDQLVDLTVLSYKPNSTETAYSVTLYQGLVKGDKMDQIIQKSVELGVSRIVPIRCHRSVMQVHERDHERKLARWNRIATEAAKQCGRGLLPPVEAIRSFADFLPAAAQADLALMPWEMEREQSIRTALQTFRDKLPRQHSLTGETSADGPAFSVIIGPEGGITEAEADQALQAGIQPVSLGRRILRTETAGPAVLAMILYQFDAF